MRLVFRPVIILLFLFLIIPAQANNNGVPQFASTGGYRVTTNTDSKDGLCNSHCSLREAIIAANNDTGLNPVVYIPNGTYTLSLAGTDEDAALTGDLDITRPMSIVGEGRDTTIIDANGIDRAFDVYLTPFTEQNEYLEYTFLGVTQLLLSDLTIQNGNVPDGMGGGIRISSTAPDAPYILVIDTLIKNSHAEDGGGLAADFAYIESHGLRMLNNSADNRGGGAYVTEIRQFVEDKIFIDGNSATYGGGIYFAGLQDMVSIRGAIVNNLAVDGGGIYEAGGFSVGSSILGTISGNQATNNGGGLFFNNQFQSLSMATITNNTADADSDGNGDGGGIYQGGSGTSVTSSIIYGNIDTGGEAPECAPASTTLTTSFKNVFGNMLPCTVSAGGNTVISQDPLLQPLADNGGDTLTHALHPDSPAVGINQCDSLGTDQRGISFLYFVECEPGAYSYANGIPYSQFPPRVALTHTTTNVQGFAIRPEQFNGSLPGLIGVSYPDDVVDILNSTTNPAEIDNPQNYRLLTAGSNSSFQTNSCDSLQGDDEVLSFTLSYDRSTWNLETLPSVLLIPADGGRLYAGPYRLIVCDSITDLDGNELDGNSDFVAGGDYVFDFTYTDAPNQVLYVNATADTTDGVCNTTHCSLRDAVRAANALTGTTEIRVPAGLYTLNLSGAGENSALTGDLDLLKNITIVGAGIGETIIDGNGADRIFDAYDELRVDGVTLQNGNSDDGGAIRTTQYVAIFRSSLENNTATTGGAIYAAGISVLHLYASSLSDNTATSDDGGAVLANSAIIHESAFIGNHAVGKGSAVTFESGFVYNSTFSGNTGNGGTLFYYVSLHIDHNTIANNDTGIFNGDYELAELEGNGNILSNNGAANCATHPDFALNLNLQIKGYFNVISDSSCNFGTRNLYNTDPLLLPLNNNGGHTLTHALSSSSPARNLLLMAACRSYIDQRGVDREADGLCDAGAFERISADFTPPTNLVVTGTTDTSVSLSWTDTTDETGYHIERSDNGGTNWTEVGTTAANVTTFENTGLTCSTSYQYRVRATDGTDFSAYSNTVSDSTDGCLQTGPVFTVITDSGNPGDGCRVDYCSLEAAMEVANADEGETISVPAGDYGAAYSFSHSIHITGAGAGQTIFDGHGVTYLFGVADGAPEGISITLDWVTLRNGYSDDGPAVFSDPDGILASVTVRNSHILNNVGDATIFYSESADEIALTFENVVISHNVSEGNGLILLTGATALTRQLVIRDSVIRENTTTAAFGVGFAKIITSGYELVIEDSAFVGNGTETGGSLFEISGASNTPIEISNSTFSGNLSLATRASVADISGSVNLVMTHNTITQNTGTEEVFNYNPGSTRSMTVFGNIFAGNEGEDFGCSNVVSLGYNIFGNMGCTFTPTATDILTTDPQLTTLAEDGDTWVHAPQNGSPAIDAIPAGDCTLTTDQRGISRPQSTGCDIGAFEWDNLQMGPVFNVNTTVDANDGACDAEHCTLREAIIAANSVAGANTITIPAGTYILTTAGAGEDNALTGDLDVLDLLTIQGAGTASTIIDANNLDRAFDIHGSDLASPDDPYREGPQITLSDMTIQNGSVTGENGGGFRAVNASTLQPAPRPYMVLQDIIIQNSRAANGGGLAITAFHTDLTRVRLTGNTATNRGGGLYFDNPLLYPLVHYYSGLYIDANEALFGGGAYIQSYVRPTDPDADYFDIRQTSITNNSAEDGGGIYLDTVDIFSFSGTISGNTAINNGAGLYTYFSAIDGFTYSTITNNTADSDSNGSGNGGAMYFNTPRYLVTISHSIVSGNIDNSGEAHECDSTGVTLEADNNILATLTPCTIQSGNGNIFANPLLLPLADNGGQTLTHSLQIGSPAINAIPAANCTEAFDQRGISRPQFTGCDIGAYEATAADFALPAPTNLSASAVSGTGTEISLLWVDNALNESNYRIERSPDNSNWSELTSVAVNSTTYLDSGVANLFCGTLYYYRIRAYRTADNLYSGYSNVASATTAPCQPSILVTDITATSIEFIWNDVPTETEYRVERSVDSGGTWTEIDQLPQNSGSFTDNTVVCETPYHYRIRAYRSSDSIFSAYSNVVTPTGGLCPLTAPVNFSATNITATGMTLQWSENNHSETAHLLERNDGSGWVQIAQLGANSTSYADSNLTCETTYQYRVRAYRSSDDVYTDYSSIISPTTAFCPVPKNPTGLQTTAIDARSVDLLWTDSNLGVMRYTVERSGDAGASWQAYPQLAQDVTAFHAYNLQCQYEYRFRVRGVRIADNLLTDYSNIITAQTLACPALAAPNAPTVMNVDRISVTLAFTPDSSGEVNNWQLERFMAGNWQTLATLPVLTTQYTDSNLTCDTAYAYRLRSYRAEDNTYSAFSTETPVTTAACPDVFQSTVGLYRNGVWQFTTLNSSVPDITFRFGPAEAGWTPLVGDWDGDGVDGIGVYRNGLFILRNTSSAGVSDATFYLGAREVGWQPLVGDWNGDGVDTIGVYKDGTVMLTNNHTTLSVDYRFRLGDGTAGWRILAGDWDKSGADSVGLYRGGFFYLTNNLDSSGLRRPFLFGPAQTDWLPLVGDWNADGFDSIGVYRQSVWRLRDSNSAGGSDVGFNFGAREAGWIPLASYRGGSSSLMALASAANVAVPVEAAPTQSPTEMPVTEMPTEVTVEPTSVPEVTEEATAIPTVETMTTVEPTIIPVPVEVTAEVTEAVSQP